MKKLLEEIFSIYYQDVYCYLLSLCRDAALAEDLTSEVFVEVVRSIAGFRWESDVRTWLYTIARRRWYHYLKWKKQQIPTHSIAEYRDGSDMDLELGIQRREVVEYINRVLADETERNRRIFQLRLEGFSFYEIGKMVGISENSARVIQFRIRTKLRRLLKEGGFDSDTVDL